MMINQPPINHMVPCQQKLVWGTKIEVIDVLPTRRRTRWTSRDKLRADAVPRNRQTKCETIRLRRRRAPSMGPLLVANAKAPAEHSAMAHV